MTIKVGQLASFDIVANEVAVDVRGGGSPFEARLRQGVLDTNAEALLGALACQQRSDDVVCESTGNAAEAFAASLRQRRSWRVARNAADLDGVLWPEDGLARVRQHLAAGYSVLLPEQPPQGNATWWRIDADRGHILGLGEQGWGSQETVEKTVTTAMVPEELCRRLDAISVGMQCHLSVSESGLSVEERLLLHSGCFVAMSAGGIGGVFSILNPNSACAHERA